MKTIKTIFAILFLSSMFIACEADTVNDETLLNLDDTKIFGSEEEDEEVVKL